jgi:hypothetical protein
MNKKKKAKKNRKKALTFTPGVDRGRLLTAGVRRVLPEKVRAGRHLLDLTERGVGRSTS